MPPALRLALHYLRRSWVRSGLSALAVSSGVATLVAADLISRSVTEEIVRTAESQAITGFMSEQLNVGLTAVGLVIALGAGFLTFNAFSMAVAQRREDIGRLRAAGMTRGQVLGMLLSEAGLIGLAGSLVGLAGGVFVSRALLWLLESTSEMFNRFGTAPLSTVRLLGAAGLGMGVACISALVPGLHAGRVSPLAAQRPSAAAGLSRPSLGPLLGAGVAASAIWAWLILDPPGVWILPPWSTTLAVALMVVWLVCLAAAFPAVIDLTARGARRWLSPFLGPTAVLASDNLRRARSRSNLTSLSLAVGVAMIVGTTGYMAFWFDELFFRLADSSLEENPGLGFFPIDIEAGLQAYQGLTTFILPVGLESDVRAAVGARAEVVEVYFTLAPQLSFMGDRYFSYVLEPRAMRRAGDLFFSMAFGDWDQALALADQGCALFLTPTVARKNGVWLGDTLGLDTPAGTLECAVAGIGPSFVGASIISDAAVASFGLTAPVGVTVFPRSPSDKKTLLEDLAALRDRYPGTFLIDLSVLTSMQREGMKSVQTLMDGLLVLAVLTAAMGVVNTVAIGLRERRREFGILRAAGADRRQVERIAVLEGVLMGVLGAVIGLLAGIGVVLIYAVVSAGSPLGFPNFPVWEAALSSAEPALRRGMLAVALTPFLTGLAAWIPTQRALRGSVAENLAETERW
jgi:putative ABC transport system permease protein